MIYRRALIHELVVTMAAVFTVLLAITAVTQWVRYLGQAAAGVLAPEAVLAFLGFGTVGVLPVLLTVTLFTSVLLVLARMGRRLAGRVADILSQRDFGQARTRSGGFLTTVGGLLLVMPGFITDCIGLLLLVPAVRHRLMDHAPLGRSRPSRRVLELDRRMANVETDTEMAP
mgnify:CR=1 FL=1